MTRNQGIILGVLVALALLAWYFISRRNDSKRSAPTFGDVFSQRGKQCSCCQLIDEKGNCLKPVLQDCPCTPPIITTENELRQGVNQSVDTTATKITGDTAQKIVNEICNRMKLLKSGTASSNLPYAVSQQKIIDALKAQLKNSGFGIDISANGNCKLIFPAGRVQAPFVFQAPRMSVTPIGPVVSPVLGGTTPRGGGDRVG